MASASVSGAAKPVNSARSATYRSCIPRLLNTNATFVPSGDSAGENTFPCERENSTRMDPERRSTETRRLYGPAPCTATSSRPSGDTAGCQRWASRVILRTAELRVSSTKRSEVVRGSALRLKSTAKLENQTVAPSAEAL